MMEYAYPAVLVSTDWVAQYCHDPYVRLVEADEDVLLYDAGHIPGAVQVDWRSELQQQVIRDYLDKEAFAQLLGCKGIGNQHTVVFYGDNHNWWACYAFWVFKLYGHQDCRVLNGGRQKWLDEGRPLTQERPQYVIELVASFRSRSSFSHGVGSKNWKVQKYMYLGEPALRMV